MFVRNLVATETRAWHASHPRVVAVVLNWNAWRDTIACVESLLESNCVPNRIVICDNGSLDDSVARLMEWGERRGSFVAFGAPAEALDGPASDAPLVLVRLPENGGYARGNNLGIRYAIERCEAEYVWILNNDTIVEREALERMIEVATADPSVGIVGSKLLRHDAPDTIQALGGGYIVPILCHDTQLGNGRKAAGVGTKPILLDHLVGASLLVRAEAVRRVGPIDESYFLYREETDWCIRMRRAGWKLYCCTTATVWHKQSHSIGFKSPLHDYYAVRNMLRLVWKFYPAAMPTAFGYFAVRALAPKLLRFEFARLQAVLYAYGDFVTGVTGRSERHTDRMFANSYLGSPARPAFAQAPPAGRRPNRLAVVKGVAIALGFVLAAGLLPSAKPGGPGRGAFVGGNAARSGVRDAVRPRPGRAVGFGVDLRRRVAFDLGLP
ncbi:MAG TPA: glycosyltransferase family 2 protein [Candidatus Tumulicola sp.]